MTTIQFDSEVVKEYFQTELLTGVKIQLRQGIDWCVIVDWCKNQMADYPLYQRHPRAVEIVIESEVLFYEQCYLNGYEIQLSFDRWNRVVSVNRIGEWRTPFQRYYPTSNKKANRQKDNELISECRKWIYSFGFELA